MTSRVLIGLESTLLLRKKPALDRKNRNGAWNSRHEHGNRWHLTTVPVAVWREASRREAVVRPLAAGEGRGL